MSCHHLARLKTGSIGQIPVACSAIGMRCYEACIGAIAARPFIMTLEPSARAAIYVSHVAETNRRPADHLARKYSRGRRHFSRPLAARRAEADWTAWHDSPHIS